MMLLGIMLYGSCHVLPVESTCTGGWGRGIVRRLMMVLFQPLWLLLREVLAQLKKVESGEVLMKGGVGSRVLHGHQGQQSHT